MKEYELINPSDPYTFLADDLETAALVVLALSTAYGAKSKDGDEEVPVFLFGGAEEAEKWYTEQFGRSPEDGTKAKKKQLASVFESVMLGNFEDRRRYAAALEAITDPNKRDAFISVWQDGHSSLNNIGTYCHSLAKALKKQEEKK